MHNDTFLPPLRILAQQPQQLRVGIELPAALACFDGHFPGFPVLPGVVQIHWARQLAARHLGVQGRFAGMEQIKFADIVTPGDALTLLLDWDAAAGRLGFAYEVDGRRVSSGRIRLAA